MANPPKKSPSRRSTRANRSAPPAPPVPAPAPLSQNRKRSRADLAESEPEEEEEEEAEQGPGPSSSKKKKKRGKRAKKEEEVKEVEEPMAVDEERPPSDGDRTSATLDADAPPARAESLEEVVSPLDGLSAEERRAAKGKGKAVEEDDAAPPKKRGAISSSTKEETSRAEKELAFKDSVIQTQAALLASLRSSMACTVCLETLDKPYSLACGHIFCRKCLLTWFHRADPAAENAPAALPDESSSSSDSEDDVVLGPADGVVGGDGSSSDDSESESDGSGGAPSSMRATVGGRQVEVRGAAGASDDSVWQSMQRAFAAGAPALLARGSGSRIGIRSGVAGAVVPSPGRRARRVEEEIEPNTGERGMAVLRAMRLRRFEGGEPADEAVSTDGPGPPTAGTSRATNEASATAASASSTRPRRHRSPALPVVPPPPASASSSSSDSSDSVVILRDAAPLPADPAAAIPPPAAPPAHAPPIGAHRRNNLVCPQCRATVEIAPFRIFVLSEMVALVRAAEAAGELGAPGSVEPAAAAGPSTGVPAATLPGLDESDLTWAGLFRAPGTETAQERRARNAAVMRDHEDHVRRCFDCNWEIDEETGLCEGCGREWDLSSDDGESLAGGGPAGGVFGFGGGFHFGGGGGGMVLTDSERSGDDDDDDSSQGGFIVEDVEEDGPLTDEESAESSQASPRRRRREHRSSPQVLIIESSDSESDDAPSAPRRRGATSGGDPPRRRDRAVVIISSDEDGSSSSEEGEQLGEQIDVPSEAGSENEEDEDEGVESAHFRRRRPAILDDEADEEEDAEEGAGDAASSSEESVEVAQAWRRGSRHRFAELEDSEEE